MSKPARIWMLVVGVIVVQSCAEPWIPVPPRNP
jgi:hypothetical protein